MLEEERIIDGRTASPNEENVDRALRPSLLNEYVGQEAIREQLQIFIAAAKRRDRNDCYNRYKRRADSRTGARQRCQTFSFLSALCKCRYHRPKRDVHHRICHTPEDIGDCRISD